MPATFKSPATEAPLASASRLGICAGLTTLLKTLTFSIIAAAAGAFLATGASAETVSLPALKDNTLFEDFTGSLSSGAGESIFAGRTGTRIGAQIRRAAIAFDLTAAIPAGATITGATLRLYLESAGQNAIGTNVSLHVLAADWGEGVSAGIVGNSASATPGDATWLHTFYDSVLWSEPGGDFDHTASAAISIGQPFQFYEWSGAGLLADIQEWRVDPSANFGWLILGEEGDITTALRFDSRESTFAANRPQLVLTYTIPEPAGAAAFTIGAAFILALRRPSEKPRLKSAL